MLLLKGHISILFFKKCNTLIPANDPVPTAPGPTQLNVGLGECILFLASISVNLLLLLYSAPFKFGEL